MTSSNDLYLEEICISRRHESSNDWHLSGRSSQIGDLKSSKATHLRLALHVHRVAAVDADVQLGVGQVVEQRNVEAVLFLHADITVVRRGLQLELVPGHRIDLLLLDQLALSKTQIAQFSDHLLLQHLVAAIQSDYLDVLSNQILDLLLVLEHLEGDRVVGG